MPAPPVYGLPTIILSRVGVVQIDAVLNETHRFDNLVTEHPVEDGSPRTDHIVNRPVHLEMEGRITDTPTAISLLTGAAGLLGEALEVSPEVAAGLSTLTLAGATLPGRAKLAYQELVALYVSRETFKVITGLAEYENMTFEKLLFPRQRQDGRSIRFRATLKELIVVGVEAQTNAERVASEVENTALEPDNLGTQPTENFTGAAL